MKTAKDCQSFWKTFSRIIDLLVNWFIHVPYFFLSWAPVVKSNRIHFCQHLIGCFSVKILLVKSTQNIIKQICMTFWLLHIYYGKRSWVISFWRPEIFPNEIPKIRSLCVPHGTLDNSDGLELFYTLVNSSV